MALCSHFKLLVGFCASAGRTRVFAWLPSELGGAQVLEPRPCAGRGSGLLRCESAWTRPSGRQGTVACCISCALRERSVDSSCATEARVFPCASFSCAPLDHPQDCGLGVWAVLGLRRATLQLIASSFLVPKLAIVRKTLVCSQFLSAQLPVHSR